MALTTNIRVLLAAKETGALDLGSTSASHTVEKSLTYANGAAAGQANVAWSDTRTIAASGTDDLDLAGTLTAALGGTVTAVKVKAIVITAADANTNNVVVGGAASAQFASIFGDATDKVVIRPGGVFALAVGEADLNAYAVTATTADLLRVANSGAGTSVTYSIAIVGTAT